jgi:hypothetical protein
MTVKTPKGPLAITANRLEDGAPVWIGLSGALVDAIEHAEVFEGEAAEAALALALRRETEIVGPYLITVVPGGGARDLDHVKETIRATGPTVTYGDEARR